MFDESRIKELKEHVAAKAQKRCGCMGWKAVAITVSEVTKKHRDDRWRKPKPQHGVLVSLSVLSIRAKCVVCETPSGPVMSFHCDEYLKEEST